MDGMPKIPLFFDVKKQSSPVKKKVPPKKKGDATWFLDTDKGINHLDELNNE